MKQILGQISDNLGQLVKDDTKKISSKRAVGIIALIIMVITWVANLWFDMTVDDFVFNGFLYIVAVALTTTVAEKFTKANMIKTKKVVDGWTSKDNEEIHDIQTDINLEVKTKKIPKRKLIK